MAIAVRSQARKVRSLARWLETFEEADACRLCSAPLDSSLIVWLAPAPVLAASGGKVWRHSPRVHRKDLFSTIFGHCLYPEAALRCRIVFATHFSRYAGNLRHQC